MLTKKWSDICILHQFSRGHNLTPKGSSNYISRTAKLLHDMYKLKRVITSYFRRWQVRMFHGKWDVIRTFSGWKTWKNNTEFHQNFTEFYKKKGRGSVWNSNILDHQQWKGKNANKLWQKLSNMSWNIELGSKTSFVWEKKNHKTISEISFTLVQCSLKCRVAFFRK